MTRSKPYRVARNRVARTILAIKFMGLSLGLPASQFTVGELMGALAHNTHGIATFTEEKYLSILDEPISSSGELSFVPPDRLEKRTLRPQVETMILKGNAIIVAGPIQSQELSLGDYPEIVGMIASIRATLAGDLRTLEGIYHLVLGGSRDHWILLLTPRDSRSDRLIDHIRMGGTGGELLWVEIWQTDGDHSVMHIRERGGS